MKKYYTTSYTGPDKLIRHDERECRGLDFQIVAFSGDEKLIVVEGEEHEIQAWANRVHAVEKTKEQAQSVGEEWAPERAYDYDGNDIGPYVFDIEAY